MTPNPHICMQKLQGIGAKLIVWNKITFRDIGERKDSIIKDIAMVDSLEPSLRATKKVELEEMFLRTTRHRRQNTRVKWAKEVSRYFHRIAHGRRKKKFIKSLVSDNGTMLDDQVSILKEILIFFDEIYSKPNEVLWRVEGLEWALIHFFHFFFTILAYLLSRLMFR